MRDVPVVRMFAAFLGKIHTRARRSEQNGFITHIITGLGNTYYSMGQIDESLDAYRQALRSERSTVIEVVTDSQANYAFRKKMKERLLAMLLEDD